MNKAQVDSIVKVVEDRLKLEDIDFITYYPQDEWDAEEATIEWANNRIHPLICIFSDVDEVYAIAHSVGNELFSESIFDNFEEKTLAALEGLLKLEVPNE